MNRRKFLLGAASACTACASLGPAVRGEESQRRQAPIYYDPVRLYHVGVSSWSFRNLFYATREADFQLPDPQVSLLDLPSMIADRYEVHKLELSALHFASTERQYILELRRQAYLSRSIILNLQIDLPDVTSEGGLASPDSGTRANAVELVEQWITIAREIGARSISVSPGNVNSADLSPVIESCRRLAFFGRERGVATLLVNGPETDANSLLAILRGVGSLSVRALPDFEAFPNDLARNEGLRLLFSRANGFCHASGVVFDGNGNETTFDFPACVRIAREMRFRGVYSAIYLGRDDPYQGVQNVINELVRLVG
jgi:hypothetical protein